MLAGVPPGEGREEARRELSASDPASVLQATRALIRFTSHDWVSRIDVPTAVLVMTRDRLVPTLRQYKLGRSIPGARVFEVDADHLACVRAPERFVPALRRACDWVVEESASRQPASSPDRP
jgi:pimeloyl-ACP methyl ester carboxylesterase